MISTFFLCIFMPPQHSIFMIIYCSRSYHLIPSVFLTTGSSLPRITRFVSLIPVIEHSSHPGTVKRYTFRYFPSGNFCLWTIQRMPEMISSCSSVLFIVIFYTLFRILGARYNTDRFWLVKKAIAYSADVSSQTVKPIKLQSGDFIFYHAQFQCWVCFLQKEHP